LLETKYIYTECLKGYFHSISSSHTFWCYTNMEIRKMELLYYWYCIAISFISAFCNLVKSSFFLSLLFHHTDSELRDGEESRMWRGKRVPFQDDKGTYYFSYFQILLFLLLSLKREWKACLNLHVYAYFNNYRFMYEYNIFMNVNVRMWINMDIKMFMYISTYIFSYKYLRIIYI
jgi:hypothetical protein